MRRTALTAWVQGYVTGAAIMYSQTGDAFKQTDFGGLQGFIDKYCSENPLEALHVAVGMLVAELRIR